MSAQGSLYDQLVKLYRTANMIGLYDAADWVRAELDRIEERMRSGKPIEGQEELPL